MRPTPLFVGLLATVSGNYFLGSGNSGMMWAGVESGKPPYPRSLLMIV